ncbi:MAG TPA: CocE/NonD family hydrolase, partial [Candidatus Thermoplasmatota archaeon]
MTSRPRANTPPALRAVALLVVTSMFLSGCIGAVRDYYGFEPEDHYVNPGVFPGNYRPADEGSTVLQQRKMVVGDPEIYRLPSAIPHSPVSGQPEAPAESTVYITVAAWLPTNGSAGTFPVIVVAGPSFEVNNESMRSADDEEPDNPFITPRGNPTVRWLLRNFLPLGYAVAIVGVRGTGTSGGCMEFLGPREAADLDQAVRFLATQEWSNGNVGMFGSGYEGATPWLVAASGNEYLKTIVPVSGWADTFGALFHNGTVETGAALNHPFLWLAGIGRDNFPDRPSEVPDEVLPPGFWVNPFAANGREPYQDRQNMVCDEAYEGFASGGYSNAAGDRGASGFWQARDYRERVLADYTGSVFMVHGLQDLTVDPHNAMPFNVELRQAGLDVKEWYGQWWHEYPDDDCPRQSPVWLTPSCRWDFAETLLHWFEYYLKDNQTVDRGPWTQVQDNRGYWRNAEDFPPHDASWVDLTLHGN